MCASPPLQPQRLPGLLQLTERSPLVPPRLIHYKPKTRRREQIDAKDHRASATPDYLTKELSKAPDAARAYDHMPAGEPPLFSRDPHFRWLYEQQASHRSTFRR
ncbi:hypothetical protein EMIT0P44_280015 [Pseudomonas sp. IT-P44]